MIREGCFPSPGNAAKDQAMRPGHRYQAEKRLDDMRGSLGIGTRPLYKIVRRKALVLCPSSFSCVDPASGSTSRGRTGA